MTSWLGHLFPVLWLRDPISRESRVKTADLSLTNLDSRLKLKCHISQIFARFPFHFVDANAVVSQKVDKKAPEEDLKKLNHVMVLTATILSLMHGGLQSKHFASLNHMKFALSAKFDVQNLCKWSFRCTPLFMSIQDYWDEQKTKYKTTKQKYKKVKICLNKGTSCSRDG